MTDSPHVVLLAAVNDQSTDTQPRYVAFIDEAGDPGLKRVAPIDENGASEWFVVSAVVVRTSRDLEVVDWVRNLREQLKSTQRPDLHYRGLHPTKRLVACQTLATLPVRVFVVASNKVNMRGHRNARAERVPSQEYFYNWCIRLLLERVTDFCLRKSIEETGEPKYLRLEFSRRGGLYYDQMMAYHKYLEMNSRVRKPYLSKREISWPVLHWDHYHIYPHSQRAGLQLADIAASAFYQAADARAKNWDTRQAMALGPVLGRKLRTVADEGLTLLPPPRQAAHLLPEQRQIFEYFGYDFQS